ncbi:MAG: type secretion system protein VirD4 [Hyphomicrobiales bacterium]|jgi:type IV secretion system protein VirD4|nr:type secretion system protein VirD4 [Hyphomicrobiales bacterium]
MTEERGTLFRLAWHLLPGFSEILTKGHFEATGAPHPYTPEGRRFAKAEADFHALLTNPPPVHGKERWMSGAEARALGAQHAKLFESASRLPDLLALGAYLDPTSGAPVADAFSQGPGHVLTIAGTRAGKGTCQIIPNLLCAPNSMLVIDPKGENYGITAATRRTFGAVHRIDPFRITAAYDSETAFAHYNPLDFVHDDGDARSLAAMLLGDRPLGRDGSASFFYDEGVNLLTVLLLAAARSEDPTIAQVRRQLALARDDSDAELARLTEDDDPVVALGAGVFRNHDDRTRANIIAQINSATAPWDTKALREVSARSDFDIADLKTEPMTIYVILPFDKLDQHRGLLRMMIGQFYSAMLRDMSRPKQPIMCIVDEFPALGRMEEFVRALAEIAGLDVRLWLFAQSLASLRRIYGEGVNAILANCATQCVFGVSDGETARWLSDQLGSRTGAREVVTPSTSAQAASNVKWLETSIQGGVSVQRGVQFYAIPLLTPQDARRMLGVGTNVAVVMETGKSPSVVGLFPWFTNPVLAKQGADIRAVGRVAGQRPPRLKWGIYPKGNSERSGRARR